MGTAEEAAAGEVTDRKRSRPSADLFVSVQPRPSSLQAPTIVILVFCFFFDSSSKTEPVDPRKVEKVTELCPTSL